MSALSNDRSAQHPRESSPEGRTQVACVLAREGQKRRGYLHQTFNRHRHVFFLSDCSHFSGLSFARPPVPPALLLRPRPCRRMASVSTNKTLQNSSPCVLCPSLQFPADSGLCRQVPADLVTVAGDHDHIDRDVQGSTQRIFSKNTPGSRVGFLMDPFLSAC